MILTRIIKVQVWTYRGVLKADLKREIDNRSAIDGWTNYRKKYECKQNVWQIFVDFKKAYNSIPRKSFYNIMYIFEFLSKFISLTKLCMNSIKYQVRIDSVLSEELQIVTGLKQRDDLSPLLFNIAQDKVARNVQRDNCDIDIGTNKIGI